MSPVANQILQSALTLPDDERAELADCIWRSINGDTQEQVAESWAAEIKRRIEASDRGEVTFLSHEEVWQRLESKYGKLDD